MTIQVVQKVSPLGWPPPPILLADPVEIGRKRRDQIKLPPEIRKGLVRLNRPDAALDLEEFEQPSKKREFVDIQPEAFVPKMLKHEEKETASAAQIQDRLGRAAMQLQVLRADNVQLEPA